MLRKKIEQATPRLRLSMDFVAYQHDGFWHPSKLVDLAHSWCVLIPLDKCIIVRMFLFLFSQ